MQSIKSIDETSRQNTESPQEDAPLELELMDLKLYRLGETELNARWCSTEEFVGFAQGLVQVEASSLRTVFQRRDFLNWCLENKLLRVESDRLVIVEKEVVYMEGGEDDEDRNRTSHTAQDTATDRAEAAEK